MLITLSVIIICIVMLFTALFLISPGSSEPLTDKNGQKVQGSISEKTFITIGGVRQGMFIRSMDVNNPVLLFVHGGPSFPEFFLVDKYHVPLEDHFTVCFWEQRGGGISYSKEVELESMTLEQLSADAVEVTNYLRERFNKEKIYLLAHSGGTSFAIKTAADYPQLYYAYIAIAQITKQGESEKLAYKYMIDKYASLGNSKMVSEFKKYPILDDDSLVLPFFKSLLRDKSMHELGIGTMHNMRSVFKDIFLPVWTCRAYTLKEKFNIWKSKFSLINKSKLRDQLIISDINKEVPELEIPAYFFSGKYDLTVNIELAKTYLKNLQAPVKGFYTFNRSAHSPMFEEPERLIEILVQDVLNGTNNLADKN